MLVRTIDVRILLSNPIPRKPHGTFMPTLRRTGAEMYGPALSRGHDPMLNIAVRMVRV
jgi:hypothetical protein